jgi:hypothetical protein
VPEVRIGSAELQIDLSEVRIGLAELPIDLSQVKIGLARPSSDLPKVPSALRSVHLGCERPRPHFSSRRSSLRRFPWCRSRISAAITESAISASRVPLNAVTTSATVTPASEAMLEILSSL